MAVTSCKRKDTKRGDENDKTRKLTEEYHIIVNSTSDEPSTIMDSSFADVPKVGDEHPTDPLVTVKSRRILPTGNRLHYTMEVSYDNNADNESSGGGGGGGGPVQVLEVTIGAWWEDYIQEYEIGAGGRPKMIKNTFGDPIKYEARRPQPLITISAVTEDPGLGGFVHAMGSVNEDRVSWLGMDFEKDQLMFDEYRTTSVGNNKWKENFVYKGKYVFSPEQYGDGGGQEAGWQPWILNAGLWQWIQQDGQRTRSPIYALDKDGDKAPTKPVTEPWPLNNVGEALTRDKFDTDRVFLNFDVFPRINFAGAFKFDFSKVVNDKLKVEFGL